MFNVKGVYSMKKALLIIVACLVFFTVLGCITTTSIVPLVYTNNQNTEFEILGTFTHTSTSPMGYVDIYNIAKAKYPATDFVIDIVIDQRVIKTSYHIIVFLLKQLFSADFGKTESVRYEYVMRGTAIRYKNVIVSAAPATPARTNDTTIPRTNTSSAISSEPATQASTNIVTFPSNIIGTWKRDEYENTLTFNINSIKSSTTSYVNNLVSISDDLYTLVRSSNNSTFSITIKYINNNIEISGGTGTGQGNWNGIWKKQ